MRRDDGLAAELAGQGPGLIALVGAVGQQRRSNRLGTEAAQEVATPGRVARLTGREGEPQDGAVVNGEHVELGRPAGARTADRLAPPRRRAPLASGCSWMMVLSSDSASQSRAAGWSASSAAKTRSNTPALAQRLSRM